VPRTGLLQRLMIVTHIVDRVGTGDAIAGGLDSRFTLFTASGSH